MIWKYEVAGLGMRLVWVVEARQLVNVMINHSGDYQLRIMVSALI